MFVTTDTPTEPEYKFITDEDSSAYEVWCRPHVVAFNPVPTSPLYHYTAGNGLIEIIKSGELWSTQVACLNDSSELLYPIEFQAARKRAALIPERDPRETDTGGYQERLLILAQ